MIAQPSDNADVTRLALDAHYSDVGQALKHSARVALLATKLLGAPQELLAVVLGVLAAIGIMAVSLAYQQSRYQVVVAPTAASSLP